MDEIEIRGIYALVNGSLVELVADGRGGLVPPPPPLVQVLTHGPRLVVPQPHRERIGVQPRVGPGRVFAGDADPFGDPRPPNDEVAGDGHLVPV